MAKHVKEKQDLHTVIISGDILSLVRDKTISLKDAILLARIDNLVRSKGEGCWDTRESLGEYLGIERRQVSRAIEHLTNLGLVRQVGTRNFQNGAQMPILETKFSQVSKKGEGVRNDMGEGVRNDMGEGVIPDTQVKNTHSSYSLLKKKRGNAAFAAASSGEKENEMLFPPKKEKNILQEDIECALILIGGLKEAKIARGIGSVKSWSKEFSLLRRYLQKEEEVPTSLLTYVKWYVGELVKVSNNVIPGWLGKRNFRTYKTAKSFCKEFKNSTLIQDWYEQSRKYYA